MPKVSRAQELFGKSTYFIRMSLGPKCLCRSRGPGVGEALAAFIAVKTSKKYDNRTGLRVIVPSDKFLDPPLHILSIQMSIQMGILK